MDCPYAHLGCAAGSVPDEVTSCPRCGRFLKRCAACGAANRAFANFCRACHERLAPRGSDWPGFKGGIQRLGVNTWPAPSWDQLEIREVPLCLDLGDSCRSLLGYDRHLIAVAQHGAIEVVAPESPSESLRLAVEGPVSCEPCIEQGVVYLGSPGCLTACSLGLLTFAQPRLEPLWQLPLSGTPIQALTALDGLLYLTVVRDGLREVQVVESLERKPPASPRVLYAGPHPSWVAADPASRTVAFLAQEGEAVRLQTVTGRSGRAEMVSRPVPRIALPLADQVPIAWRDGKLYGVFGDDERLCRIDVRSCELELALRDDTKLFSLGQDRDGVQVGTAGVTFLSCGVKDTFAPHDRVVRGTPVLVHDCAAVLGMLDGRLLFYDLQRPPRHEVRRLAVPGDPITAVASFDRFVAAGNGKGVVKLYELHARSA